MLRPDSLANVFAGHSSSLLLQAFHQIAEARGGSLFLVGGSLRDALLSRPFHEIDLVYSGNLGEFLESVSTNPRIKIFPLDQSRSLYRIAVRGEKKLFFDISPAGTDPASEAEINRNLAERDFTINALALPVKGLASGAISLLDPQNGLADLERKQIRTLSVETLQADPIRVLRGFRFAAILGFSIERKTSQLFAEAAPMLKNTSMERIRDELFKILAVRESHPWLLKLEQAGIFDLLFPDSELMKRTPQDSRHHAGEVWPHSLETVRCLEKLFQERGFPEGDAFISGERSVGAWLKFVALFHDIGKPSTRTTDEKGHIHFYGHEEKGEMLMRNLCSTLRLSAKENDASCRLVRLHLRPAQLSRSPDASEPALARLLRAAKPYPKELFFLSMADTLAKPNPSPETVAFLAGVLDSFGNATIR